MEALAIIKAARGALVFTFQWCYLYIKSVMTGNSLEM